MAPPSLPLGSSGLAGCSALSHIPDHTWLSDKRARCGILQAGRDLTPPAPLP